MFDILYDNSEEGDFSSHTNRIEGPIEPPSRRGSTKLCGLKNQGATCYLNSLIQTLLFTPEFKDALFHQIPCDLAMQSDSGNGPRLKIPSELQKLFVQLLLTDQQHVTTNSLTDSFGWVNDQESQQHDVQELNRILFCALEDSLAGTEGQNLIRHLYRGTIVNQIICDECGTVSEREEDFLDLSVTVKGRENMGYSLYDSFIAMETLDGNNQYLCSKCDKLVNAKKGTKLRSLPPILTISLLRFNFDYIKLERYKETGKFEFPKTIDLTPFCENNYTLGKIPGQLEYELFSVVIHKGSCHGGHYRAYIHDIDELGHWAPTEKEPIQPIAVHKDPVQYNSALELIEALLRRPEGMSVHDLCQAIQNETGVSWNRLYKKQHGPIVKFLESCSETLVLEAGESVVRLRHYSEQSEKSINPKGCYVLNDTKCDEGKIVSPKRTVLNDKAVKFSDESRNASLSNSYEHSEHWFDFNDSVILPIHESQIEKQFSGKESAYMLFYRQKTLTRSAQAKGSKTFGLPDWCCEYAKTQNELLTKQRNDYEDQKNLIKIILHLGEKYMYEYKVGLRPKDGDSLYFLDIPVDKRKTVEDLRLSVLKYVEDVVVHSIDPMCLSFAKELPAGLHLYDPLNGNNHVTISEAGITDDTHLFMWNGTTVGGAVVPVGLHKEPILLNIVYADKPHIQQGYSKDMTIGQLRTNMSEKFGLEPTSVQLMKIVKETGGGDNSKQNLCDSNEKTLCDMCLRNGDTILITEVNSEPPKGVGQGMMIWVENKCNNGSVKKQIQTSGAKTVRLLRREIHKMFDIAIEKPTRMYIGDHIVHDDINIKAADIKAGSTISINLGKAPVESQIVITFSLLHDDRVGEETFEIIIDKKETVSNCVRHMIKQASLTGDSWHIKTTSWCGEADRLLDDDQFSLVNSGINHGDHLLLEEGKLPPKGFTKFTIWLDKSHLSPDMITWITSSFKGLWSGENTANQERVNIGDIEISKMTTIDNFKETIMKLKEIDALQVGSTECLRIRVIDKGCLTACIRGKKHFIQNTKLSSANNVCIQVFPEQDKLSANHIILNIQRRNVKERTYSPSTEVLWDGQKVAPLSSLQQFLAEQLNLPVEKIVLAKYLPSKSDWLILKNNPKQKTSNSSKKKSKGPSDINLRQAPYQLKDGDIIGVKNLQDDPFNEDNFLTNTDEERLKKIKQEQSDDKKKKKENKKNHDGQSKIRKPEVALKIHVDMCDINR